MRVYITKWYSTFIIFLSLFLFMTGDGIESSFISKYFYDLYNSASISYDIITLYNIFAIFGVLSSFFLCTIYKPKYVILIGFFMWILFDFMFIFSNSYKFIFYILRGFWYPLVAYGILSVLMEKSDYKNLGVVAGLFWLSFSGGMPTLGTILSYFLNLDFSYHVILIIGLLIVSFSFLLILTVRTSKWEYIKYKNKKDAISSIFEVLKNRKSIYILLLKSINNSSAFLFLYFLPLFFIETLKYTMSDWLFLSSIMFLSNIIFNPVIGYFCDKVGHTKVLRLSYIVCPITILIFYFSLIFNFSYYILLLSSVIYGISLCFFIPLTPMTSTMIDNKRTECLVLLGVGSTISNLIGSILPIITFDSFSISILLLIILYISIPFLLKGYKNA